MTRADFERIARRWTDEAIMLALRRRHRLMWHALAIATDAHQEAQRTMPALNTYGGDA